MIFVIHFNPLTKYSRSHLKKKIQSYPSVFTRPYYEIISSFHSGNTTPVLTERHRTAEVFKVHLFEFQTSRQEEFPSRVLNENIFLHAH